MNDDYLFRLFEDFSVISEEFHASQVNSAQLDVLLAKSWRHFGQHFFRYNYGFFEDEIRYVMPLRIKLSDFSLTKSQRKILRKNTDLQTLVRPIQITQETENLFEIHRTRFKSGIPDSVFDFVDTEAADVPCKALECAVYKDNNLLAVSFFDVSENAISSIYGMFDPQESSRSLGIFTLLKETEFAVAKGKTFHYLGYAYEGNSFYDYKKRFLGLQVFDWKENWIKFENDLSQQ